MKDLIKSSNVKRKPSTMAEILKMEEKNLCLKAKEWQSIKYQVWATRQKTAVQRNQQPAEQKLATTFTHTARA